MIRIPRYRPQATHNGELWPALVFVLMIVVPTGCVLWFMQAARQNERFAARQKLSEAYHVSLRLLQQRVERYVDDLAIELDQATKGTSPPAAFERLVLSGKVETVIVLGEKGRCVYPGEPTAPAAEPSEFQGAWSMAARLEAQKSFPAAAREYALIAAQARSSNTGARALQAQVRCLVRAGRNEDATRLIICNLDREPFQSAVDQQGRHIVANAELLLLELSCEANSPLSESTAAKLRQRLLDYGSVIPAAQRRFLMKELRSLWPEGGDFPTLAAEEMAAKFISTPIELRGVHFPSVCAVPSAHGRVLALLHEQTLVEILRDLMQAEDIANSGGVEILPPGRPAEATLASLPLNAPLVGWRLAMTLPEDREFQATNRSTEFLWLGMLGIITLSTVALLGWASMRRQLSLARLKNNLVATVSHEFKTPLASMQVLVDTLLEGDHGDGKTGEYLELIAKENQRLSRLIENFLTFSRLERGKYSFDFKEIRPFTVLRAVADAFRSRYDLTGCRFAVSAEEDLPGVIADNEALETALLNLMDNAYKYSAPDKSIELRARTVHGRLLLEVQDNGVGIPAREGERIFREFYQVDQRLSRNRGGCGLGLSIVDFIVKAHRGTLEMINPPGRGSLFRIMLPLAAGSPLKKTARGG